MFIYIYIYDVLTNDKSCYMCNFFVWKLFINVSLMYHDLSIYIQLIPWVLSHMIKP